MGFVMRWHDDDAECEPGRYSYGQRTPPPKAAPTSTPCPFFCGATLERVTNAPRLHIHRIAARLHRKDERTYFLGSALNTRTHHLLVCRTCKIGFSTLKDPQFVDPARRGTGPEGA